MISVKDDFNKRKQEIELYYSFLEKLLTNDYISWNETEKERIDIEFRGIAKANMSIIRKQTPSKPNFETSVAENTLFNSI